MKWLQHLVLGQHEEMEDFVAIKKSLDTRCHICERDGKLKKGKAWSSLQTEPYWSHADKFKQVLCKYYKQLVAT
jgi:hypothetical protein